AHQLPGRGDHEVPAGGARLLRSARMSERAVELEVLRYNPETDKEPHFQRYALSCPQEWVVLDVLNKIKESVDPTLSYRWSCHMAVCGSCGMVIDDFVAKLARVKPYLIPKEPPPEGAEYRQTPAQLKRYKQFTLCINCMLCYAACPEYGLIPKYLGPAAIALGHRW